MTPDEIGAWATAFIEAVMDCGPLEAYHPLWWAVHNFMGSMSTSAAAQDCWDAILEILSRKPADTVIGVLAAGPLEDLIQYHGPDFIDRIEAESRRNPAFRRLLGGVWRSSSPEIWARIEKARGEVW